MQRGLSLNAKAIKVQNSINDNDFISKVPRDVLEMILLRLTIEEAMRMSVLSTRWIDLWKPRPNLVLDMGKRLTTTLPNLKHEVSVRLAKAMTKVIMNHHGDLESCILHHYSSQCSDGTLQTWINTVTRMKHTKHLELVNHRTRVLSLLPETFTQQSLTSLSLSLYTLLNANAFRNCSNLKTLKLLNIIIPQVSVLSSVLEACSSLETLVMQINPLTRSGVLKIDNKNLKFLQFFSAYRFDRMEVYAVCLDVLDIQFIRCGRDNFILDAPNIRFNRNYWRAGGYPHLSYNISYLAQEKTRIWHELIMKDDELYFIRQCGCLSVSVDLTNPREVEILKEFLLMWTAQMVELEIFFKKNENARREGECSTNLWDDAKPFPSADFHVYTLWMYNFDGSNEEEMALASLFVMHKTVIQKMMIKTSSFPPMKKLKVEADVAKLKELSKGNEDLSIECF